MIADHRQLAGDTCGAAEVYADGGPAGVGVGSVVQLPTGCSELAVHLWNETSTAPTTETLIALAQACLQVGELNAAESVLEPLLADASLTDEQRATALYFTSWIAADRGDYDRERTILADALAAGRIRGRQGSVADTRRRGVVAGECGGARRGASGGGTRPRHRNRHRRPDRTGPRADGDLVGDTRWPATTTSRSGTYEKRSSLPSRPAIWNSSAPLAAISAWSST